MPVEHIEALVVGAGQSGIVASEHLTAYGIPHVVIERDRIAERWRSERWDSLVANGPSWHDRLPEKEYDGLSSEEFASKDTIVEYLEDYAREVQVPVRCGVDVTSLRCLPGESGYRVETSDGDYQARFVIVATGPFQRAVMPNVVPASSGLYQIHSKDYRNPKQLPEGGVLVVGSGSSGAQIANELRRSGRQVHLSMSAHTRPPRTYRGRDIVWWMGVLGIWDQQTPSAGADHVTLALSGAYGGWTVDFRNLAESGITLVGRTAAYDAGTLRFADGLKKTIADGDAFYLKLLADADAYVDRNALDLPQDPDAWVLGEMPRCVSDPIRELDVHEAGITSIIWATGYTYDFGWLHVDAVDENGQPRHERGISPEPGIYFVGLPWLSRRSSSFLCGVSGDARHIAEQISVRRRYLAHSPRTS
ncbi:NAD(P)/FAD-dependent oxidoreductase [Microbacterium sp. MPKO10]|uniref:flavin-containing monooxygenase n=1 Tax=Microbacterium sp. MPKO10 TaxID=2989818 RepID=UPI0022364357|nr:NAD(P)/FAD-dependent oxidoreductase [Microbacterium sp. MPKO10]MCW4459864.1 NAD(P)/FAD-dependent oxidoreductase [Microbacterium sp. MPKO10]